MFREKEADGDITQRRNHFGQNIESDVVIIYI